MLEVQDLTTLDPTEVTQTLETLAEMVQEANPTLDVKSGVFRDIVLMYASILATATQKNIDLVRQSTSILAISQNPELVDDDILNRFASNYRITRNSGSVAEGYVTILLSTGVPTVVANGSRFLATNGQYYQTTSQFTGRLTESQLVTDSDILMLEQENGTWTITFPASSELLTSSANISRLTEFSAQSTISNLVSSFAGTDFTGGTEPETTNSLISRLQSGIAHRSLSSRPAIEAVIRADSRFIYIPGLSIIGYGDPEQIRYHSVFPIAHGGRVDVYVRTQNILGSKLVNKTCIYVEEHEDGGAIWQCTLSRDEAAGFYEVSKITKENQTAGSFPVISDTRGFDLTESTDSAGLSFIPDIEEAVEATYSRYSTSVIRFREEDADTGSLTINTSTQSFDLTLSYLPSLAEIQDIVSDRSTRSPGGDCLIKAPIPCFVNLFIDINQKRGDPNLDTNIIRQVIADTVNNTGFTGRLSAASIIATIQAELVGQGSLNASVDEITLLGRIRKPSGDIVNLSSSSVLSIPYDSSSMTTSRTANFFSNPDEINLTVTTIDIPQI